MHALMPMPTDSDRLPGLRARVWIHARYFFSRMDARQYAWLWLLDTRGAVHAVRMNAAGLGRDDRLAGVLDHLMATPELPYTGDPALGTVVPLPSAPAVPVPRWVVSWGHPAQVAIRAFADRLDADVLATLGHLEASGPYYGSAGNYTRLATLPPVVCARRLQALEQFPPLVAPLLLDWCTRPDLFGSREDEPGQAAWFAPGSAAEVLDAMDRGRDLIGALARVHRVDRALVRSAPMREPWSMPLTRARLRVLQALPAHRRPRTTASAEAGIKHLDALPWQPRDARDAQCMAAAFRRGWDLTWAMAQQVCPALDNRLNDSRDFLRAAAAHAPWPDHLPALDIPVLARAWLARHGLLSLLDATGRWHDLPRDNPVDLHRQREGIDALFGSLQEGPCNARELLTDDALREEACAMHHCVDLYWPQCVRDATRIVHLQADDGARATAQYDHDGNAEDPQYALVQLRGPCNDDADAALQAFAERIETRINAPAARPRRVRVAAAARRARNRGYGEAHIQRNARRLDNHLQRKLAQTLDWLRRQADASPRPDTVFRGGIAGMAYANVDHVLPQIEPGDALQLVREPHNRHDTHAVRIQWRGHKLGYVPRRDSQRLARLLDAGVPLTAEVAHLRDAETDDWVPVICHIHRCAGADA